MIKRPFPLKALRNGLETNQAGAELDLLLFVKGQRVGIEIKYGPPTLTKSMASALTDLKLNRIYAVHAGADRYPLHTSVEALSLPDCLRELTRG